MPGSEVSSEATDAPQENRLALGIDVGGTKTAIAVTRGAEIVAYETRPTPANDLDTLLTVVSEAAQPLVARYRPVAIGSCVPGLLDPESGVVGYAANVPALNGTLFAEVLAGRLGTDVQAENDANAAAWAEHVFGAARSWSSSFYVTVSTGVGGGFVASSGLYRGRYGYAGDVGHVTVVPYGARCSCGELGCLEAYASGTSIANRVSEAYGRAVTTREAFRAARDGEPRARAIVLEAAERLAQGLMNVAKVVDPEGLVLGGGVATNEAWFVDDVRRHLDRALRTFRTVPLEVARLGSDAGVIGAAALALEASSDSRLAGLDPQRDVERRAGGERVDDDARPSR